MNKKTIFIILGIVILVALVAIGIILRKPTIAPIETPITPSEEAAEEPTETPAETPTGTPAETPPTETLGLSSCVVLDEEYCDKGEPIYYYGTLAPQYEGQLVAVGFNLPKGTKIYAPFNGLVGIGAMGGASLVFINSPPLENTKTFFIKDIESAIPATEFTAGEGKLGARKEVKKGELIGIVRGNIVDISGYGSEYSDKKYTVTIDALKGSAYDMNSYVPKSDLLRQYFRYLK